MRRLWTYLAAGLLSLVVVGGVVAGGIYITSEAIIDRHYMLPPSTIHAASGPDAVVRGQHVAETVGCIDCHGPDLRGAFVANLGVRSANIRALLGSFSDADFDHAIRGALRPDGTSLSPNMPADAFQFMPDTEFADLLAFLRSLSPEPGTVEPPSYGLRDRLDFLTGTAQTDRWWRDWQTPAADLGPASAPGRILAMTACGPCHGTALKGEDDGGGPDLVVAASYSREDFTKLLRTGKAAGGREVGLMSEVARARFRHFTDEEVEELWAYLVARADR